MDPEQNEKISPVSTIAPMKRKVLNKQSGFTLLEVLVAIGIFSVVAMVSYSTLDSYLDQRERLTGHYASFERLQRLFLLLERDIQFVAARKVRDGGDIKPAIESGQGNVLIALTVVQPDLQSAAGVSLKRVEWQLTGNELIRSQWDVLDHDSAGKPAQLLVSDEIQGIELSYLLYTENRGLNTKDSLEPDEFPRGVELNITLVSGDAYRRVFSIVQGG